MAKFRPIGSHGWVARVHERRSQKVKGKFGWSSMEGVGNWVAPGFKLVVKDFNCSRPVDVSPSHLAVDEARGKVG